MLAIRNLTRRKVRSLLTILGVAVGVATVVALVTVARGIRKQFNGFFAAGNAHLVLTRRGASDPFISYLPDRLLFRFDTGPAPLDRPTYPPSTPTNFRCSQL